MFHKIAQLIIPILIAIAPATYHIVNGFLPSYQDNKAIYELLFISPYILLGIIAFLGLRLNQTRIFFVSFLFAIGYLLLTTVTVASFFEASGQQIAILLSLTIPLVITLLVSFGEGHLFGLKSFLRLFISIVPLFILLLAIKLDSTIFQIIETWKLSSQIEFWHLPDICLLFIATYIMTVFIVRDRSLRKFNQALLITFIPLFFAFNITSKQSLEVIRLNIVLSVSYLAISFILLHALYKLYWQKVYVDELTGIPNRRAFDEQLRKLGKHYTIVMIDIDHFKKFNDTFGHMEGDNVLRFVAKHLSDGSEFSVFRYGGEEFSIIFRGADTEDAFMIVEKMRRKLSQKHFYIRLPENLRKKTSKKQRGEKTKKPQKVQITFSAGLAGRAKSFKNPEDVIVSADKALYKAKKEGRNCVVSFNEISCTTKK